MSTEKSIAPPRIEALTFVRFFGAMIVVYFHFGRKTTFYETWGWLFDFGHEILTLFFVLSGFVLVVSQVPTWKPGVRRYYVARIARIAPVYFLALAIVIAFAYGIKRNDLTAVFLHLTFLQAWVPQYALTLNMPAWSLSNEAFFYAIFPGIVWYLLNKRPSSSRFFMLVLVWYVLTQCVLIYLLNSDFYKNFLHPSHNLIHHFPLAHLSSFLLGCAGGYLYLNHREAFHRKGPLPLIALALVLFLINYIEHSARLPRLLGLRLPLESSFSGITFLLLVLVIPLGDNFLTRALSLRPFIILGEASYAIYILQLPLYQIYYFKLLPHLSLGKESEFYVFLVMLIAVSLATYFWFELPAKRWINRRFG